MPELFVNETVTRRFVCVYFECIGKKYMKIMYWLCSVKLY